MDNDVFISYSHVNSVVADAICHRFEESGIRCWYAPRNIKVGDEWAEAIIKAIKSTRMLVLVFSDESNNSTQVRREIGAAVSAGIPIVPFKITETVPTGGMEYYLNTLHWLDAVDEPLENAIERLFVMCKAILDAEGVTTSNANRQGSQDVQGGESARSRADAGESAKVAGTAAQPAASEAPIEAAKPKGKAIAAIAVLAVLVVCLVGAFASGALSGDGASSTGGTAGSQQSGDSAATDASGKSQGSGSAAAQAVAISGDGTTPNTDQIDWDNVEAHHELPYIVADDESFVVIFNGSHLAGGNTISEFLFYNKSGTTVLADASQNVIANGIEIPDYSISPANLEPGQFQSLSGFYYGTEDGKKVSLLKGDLESMQSEVVIKPKRMDDVVLADYPVLWEADETSAANARKVDQTVVDDKNFCAMRIEDVSEMHGGFVVVHYSFMNRVSKTEEIEFGDDWLVNGQSAVVVGAPDKHIVGQSSNHSILLYVPDGDRDAAVVSLSGTVNVNDYSGYSLVTQTIDLSFDM